MESQKVRNLRLADNLSSDIIRAATCLGRPGTIPDDQAKLWVFFLAVTISRDLPVYRRTPWLKEVVGLLHLDEMPPGFGPILGSGNEDDPPPAG